MKFRYLHNSLRNRLRFVLILVGFLPFLTLLTYTIFLSETKILNKIVIEQLDTAESVVKLIDNHLNSLKKEVKFLSTLDIMDDLLVDDIDKRISRLLTKKADDLDLDVSLLSVNTQKLITASSHTNNLLKSFPTEHFTQNSGSYVEGKYFYIYSKIHASFNEKMNLGVLVLKYNLKNLNLYRMKKKSAHSYIINSETSFSIGENLLSTIKFTLKNSSFIDNKHVVVYKKILHLPNSWYLVYAVDKSVALAFLNDFISLMLYISVFIFLFIIYVSFRYSKDILKPLEELTSLTKTITKTHNYSAKLKITSDDEIAILTDSFNELLQTTSQALNDLQKENRLRLQRFTQLINVYNTIAKTKTQEECVRVSLQEINKLTLREDIYIIKDISIKDDIEFTKLYVNDFENNSKVYFASISLGIEQLKDINEKNFYNSITSMITLQLDRIRLIEQTMSVSNAKSTFISTMSHELRTPLNAIMGFTQHLITYEMLSDEQLDAVGNIENSAQYLLEMINEILDIAKIEAGKMQVNEEETNIVELLQNSYSMLYPLSLDKGVAFKFVFNEKDNKLYKTDPKILQQIVLNLISNAIKFTHNGEILLKLYSSDEKLIISVKDSGIGISKEDISKLFNEFTQVNNTSSKGTGLGLVLSQKMAKILGGNVMLMSEGLGCGVEAVFDISKSRLLLS